MNISKNLATIIPLLSRLSEEIISPVPHCTPNPSIHQVSSEEKRDIRAFTRDLRATLQDMKTALAIMREAIEFVQTKKEVYTTSLEAHTSLLAPINDIPFEILSQIFSDVYDLDLQDFHSHLTSHTATSHSRIASRCPTAPAITVARVNQQWSQVAMRTPVLWSTLVFSDSIKLEGQLLNASKCLKKSEGCPLTWVIVDVDRRLGKSGKSGKTRLQEPSLIPLLLPHVSRVCTLRIFGEYPSFLRRFRNEGATFSSLKILELAEHGSGSSYKMRDDGPLFSAGQIISFRICPGVNLDHFVFDSQSLQSFEGTLTVAQLHKLPSLRRCRITNYDKEFEDISKLSGPSIPRPLLTVLYFDLRLYHGCPLLQRLRRFTFPHLQSLIVPSIFSADGSDQDKELLILLQTSGHSLQYLSLHFKPEMDPTLPSLRRCLELTSMLERLECSLDEDWIAELCRILAQRNLVPHLRDLYISVLERQYLELESNLLEWSPPKSDNLPQRTRPSFNVTLCINDKVAKMLHFERQWELAAKTMVEYFFPGCKMVCLWGMEADDMMLLGELPGGDMDGLDFEYY